MISTKDSKAYQLSILMKNLFVSPGVLQKAFLYRPCIYNLIAKMCAGKEKKPTKLIVKLTTKTHRKPKNNHIFDRMPLVLSASGKSKLQNHFEEN